MNMCNISKSYTKTEHTIDKQHSQNGDRCSVSYYKCIFLFSLKFSLHNCDVLCRRQAKPYISVLKSWTTTKTAGSNSEVNLNVQWNLGITKDQVTGRICSQYNEVSYYRGSFPYILLLPEQRKSFVTPRTLIVIQRFIKTRFHCSKRYLNNSSLFVVGDDN